MADNAAPLQAPEVPLTVAYYVTGHGLGHATRAADVVGELCRRGHSVVVVSAAPQHVFVAEAAGAPGALSFRKRLLDCGAKQADALSVDPSGSLELYHATAVEPRETLLREEEAWLLEARVVRSMCGGHAARSGAVDEHPAEHPTAVQHTSSVLMDAFRPGSRACAAPECSRI